MPGRKRKPAKLALLEGNPGRRPIRKEPEPPEGIPEPPDFLDEYGREEWDRVAWGLNAMGVLAEIDQNVFAAYCDAYSVWRRAMEARAELRKGGDKMAGIIMERKNGGKDISPLFRVARQAKEEMIKCAAIFGIGAEARARLAVEPQKGGGKFKGLIGAKRK